MSIVNLVLTVVNTRRFTDLAADADAVVGAVWVCVPARDEAERIADLVDDLKVQHAMADLRVLICDDDSTDGTAEVAVAAAAGDPRFTVVRNQQPPPAGWTGKNHALDLLTAQIGDGTLVFVDADVRLGPAALHRAIGTLARSGGGLLTVWPSQQAGSLLEYLVQPLLSWSWLSSVPLAISERLLPRSMAVANGQFLVTSLDDYRRAGGHSAVRANITEDLALARRYRSAGMSSAIRSGRGVVWCRMYDGAADTWGGYRRWLSTEFGSPAGASVVALVAGAVYVLPVVDLVRGRRRSRALLSLTAASASRMVARHAETGALSPVDIVSAIAHPVSTALAVAAVGDSLRARRRGTLDWKGRGLTPR